MKAKTRFLLIVLALAYALASDGRFVAAVPAAHEGPERLLFRIKTVEESGGRREVISDATVEGPPGTDFDISLQGERFKMSARFLTDLVGPASLKVRARVDTRRFYGYSEQHLPLYEEDEQRETLFVGFDEAVVLLPFGRNGVGDRLKIEITPGVSTQTTRLPSGKARPLEIEILKPSPGGSVGIQAWKAPHNFAVEAVLLEDGREVARGASDFLIEEAREFTLSPTQQAGPSVASNPLTLNLTVNQYARSRPVDLATIGFDIYRTDPQGARREVIGLKWAGVGELGSELTYDLSNAYMKESGKKYELKFRIKLAEGEKAD